MCTSPFPLSSISTDVDYRNPAVQSVIKLLKLMSGLVPADHFSPGVRYLTISEINGLTRASSAEIQFTLNLLADAGLLKTRNEDVALYAWAYSNCEIQFEEAKWDTYGTLVSRMLASGPELFVYSGFRGQFSELERYGLIDTAVHPQYDSQNSRITQKGLAFFTVMSVLYPDLSPIS